MILLFIMGMGLWGRPYLEGLLEAHRRRRLIRLMRNIGKRLRGRIPQGAYREILRDLSAEFRSFLGYFFNRDCRAMTATEFSFLPPLFPFSKPAEMISPASLGAYFHRMDALRFSGEKVGAAEVSALFDTLTFMLGALEAGLREEKRQRGMEHQSQAEPERPVEAM
jgi:hypothetical protein